ncbi:MULTISPECIES: DUF7282 domain-containing protein [Halorussus]|uniref:DUF7282 domain-containing protein n=1 Tax=Halorussus TaxID=1070314 RepID=UPI0020A0A022|nr:hypothetical protein [Halorussus vallis]USZ75478.1 hypothetical protein NGM07_18855 [Halorussus vallis]
MTRKTVIVALVATVVVGATATLAVGAATQTTGPQAASDAPLAQETETATGNETTTEGGAVGETETVGAADRNASVIFLNQTAGITFQDGTPNDTTVMIERVVVPEGGFLVVHAAENATGAYVTAEDVTVGPVLGNSTYLGPGVHSNVVVQLDRPLNESQTLVAMPHRDTNDNQEYDFPQADDPYTVDGAPVVESGYVIVTGPDGQPLGGNQTAAGETTIETTTGENETTTEA